MSFLFNTESLFLSFILFISTSAIKIEPVGSCCTLIAEKLLSSNFKMTDEIAYLLTGMQINKTLFFFLKTYIFSFQGPILFDTVNFSPSAGKTTEKDLQIYAQLQKFRQSSADDSKLYDDLRKSACDVEGSNVRN